MLVKIGKSTISITWKHHNIDPETKQEYKHRWTTCIIKLGIGENSKLMAEEAKAYCHGSTKKFKKDSFSKCEGRKRSLTRAIKLMDADPNCPLVLSKEDRRDIWRKYVETTCCSFEVKVKERMVKEDKIEVINE